MQFKYLSEDLPLFVDEKHIFLYTKVKVYKNDFELLKQVFSLLLL